MGQPPGDPPQATVNIFYVFLCPDIYAFYIGEKTRRVEFMGELPVCLPDE